MKISSLLVALLVSSMQFKASYRVYIPVVTNRSSSVVVTNPYDPVIRPTMPAVRPPTPPPPGLP